MGGAHLAYLHAAIVLLVCFSSGAEAVEPPRATLSEQIGTPGPSVPRDPETAPTETRPKDRPFPRPARIGASDPHAAAFFALPRIAAETRRAMALAQAGAIADGAAILEALLDAHPGLGLLHANRAALHMLAGEPDAARAALATASALDYPDLAALIAEPLFAPLNDAAPGPAQPTPAQAAAAPVHAAVPAPILDGTGPVDYRNTLWDAGIERFTPRFAFPPAPSGRVTPRRHAAAYELLDDHARAGRAAGNHGDLYDNRDRGHSRLPPASHPQLTHVRYAREARAADIDYGLNDVVLFDRVTLGNSSTALTGGAFWRSLPRAALTRADGSGPARLYQNYASNHLYVHPAHRDFGSRHGDILPANTPYLLISRGSSGSDQPFLEAVALILAAFRPDTKARLTAEGLIAPTVQMVFRRSLQEVRSREAYLGGAAHPAAFDAADINLARMVSLANAIAADAIPPMVRIRVTAEDLGREGIDYFGTGLSEQLFDTPAAIGRIWRARSARRSVTLSAAETRDPNGRDLTFDWRLLQGDPSKVRIAPFDGGRQARITFDWQEPRPISEEIPVVSSRIDIGVFAHNGVHDAAPAIFSLLLPRHEARRTAPGPDGAMRLAEIDYAAHPDRYADPMLMARADWRDTLHYDAQGALTGWTRSRKDGAVSDFTAQGARILAPAERTRPARLETVAYPLHRTQRGVLRVEEVSSGPGPAAAASKPHAIRSTRPASSRPSP